MHHSVWGVVSSLVYMGHTHSKGEYPESQSVMNKFQI